MIRLRSYAKINLGLEVVGRRADGFHNLKTIFQAVDLFDTIEIRENPSGEIRLDGDDPTVDWEDSNTISRAFAAMYRKFGLSQGFDVQVEKRIPAGAGLGGGSSNAAVVILFLNDHFRLGLDTADLIKIGMEIGADVPFFLVGGTALADGIGEKITPLDDLEQCRIGIVVPATRVSTRLIFSKVTLTTKPFESKIDTFVKTRDFSLLRNHLEEVTFALFPEVRAVKEKLLGIMNSELVSMSGSGSAVYCAAREQRIPELKRLFPGCTTFLTKAINRRDYFLGIGASPSGKAPAFGAGIGGSNPSAPEKKNEQQ